MTVHAHKYAKAQDNDKQTQTQKATQAGETKVNGKFTKQS